MNDPFVDALMVQVRAWIAMPLAQAKAAIVAYMNDAGVYSKLDYDFVDLSVTAEEAIGLVFGI